MNVGLTRKLGLMQAQLEELQELDILSELSDLDYLSKLESRLKRSIAGLAEKGEVSENPLHALEEHWKRATDYLGKVSSFKGTYDKAFADPSRKKALTGDALLKAKDDLPDQLRRIDEDLQELKSLFQVDDWTGDGSPEPSLLAYDSMTGKGRRGLEKKFQKGFGAIIADPEKTRADYLVKGEKRQKAIESLLEEYKREQATLAGVKKEWEKGKIDHVERILSAARFLNSGNELREAFSLFQQLKDDLKEFRKRVDQTKSSAGVVKWATMHRELEKIREKSSSLP